MGKLSKNHLHFVFFIMRDPLGFIAALAQKVHPSFLLQSRLSEEM
jgi:hypothetical protein